MSAAEQEAIWERLEKHSDLINQSRADHAQLSTDVRNLTAIVRARAEKAEAQHKEIIGSIKELTAAESERAGMAKLGRGVAVAIAAIAGLVALVASFVSGRPGP